VPDRHPSLPQATGLSVAVEPIRPRARKASEAADQFKDTADTAREKTSPQWQEMREHVSVAMVKINGRPRITFRREWGKPVPG
jgi:hypothetical protein